MKEQLIENPTRIGYYLTKTIEDKFWVCYWDGQGFMDDANQDNKLMFGIKRDWIVSFVSVESALQPKEQLNQVKLPLSGESKLKQARERLK